MAKSFKLSSGGNIPSIGLGTVKDSHSHAQIRNAVLHAIEVGYRHIDTASFYESEPAIGEALQQAFQSKIIQREDIFVTSKLWCNDNSPESVGPAIKKSLSLLQLDHLDLYLMHFPIRLRKEAPFPPGENDFLPVDIPATWRAMECCHDQGLTKAIGVSNFTLKRLSNMLEYSSTPPSVNQVEMHPLWQQSALMRFCASYNIHLSAWSPLGAPGASYGTKEVIEHPTIRAIANKHRITPAQVALRWGIQIGSSVLPRSYNKTRIVENFRLFDSRLDGNDIVDISKIKQRRTSTCPFFCNNSTSPFKTLQDLWDGEI